MNLITESIKHAGLSPLAAACGVTYQAVRRWESAARLPRSELTGETDYSVRIEHATKGQVRAESLIAWTRRGWQRGVAA